VTRRPGLAVVTAAVAIGGGLVLLGATRTWSSESVPQPPPLSPVVTVHTGASLAPALPALALVALAGAGGLLATRGVVRRLVGALLTAAALGCVVLVVGVLVGGGVGAGWPLACLLGACLFGAGGVLAVRDGARWAVMGSRYARGDARPRQQQTTPADPELWDAIDRGEDPTRD
jgi:hypothetical protein